MQKLLQRWRRAPPLPKAELMAAVWECFSVLLFVSAVVPAAFRSPWPVLVFGGGLALSALLAPLLTRSRAGLSLAAALRTLLWLVAVTPLLAPLDMGPLDPQALVAACGFGLMAGVLRRTIYRRLLYPSADQSTKQLRRDLRSQLTESAAVAGVMGGHVMLLFSVAFLRTASQLVFRAWWEIIPVLAVLGTAGFTWAVRPTTTRVLAGLAAGPDADQDELLAALQQAERVPRQLSRINFALWLVCTSIGVFYFRTGPEQWSWADAVMQLAFGSLFAWGVSFYQRGWHDDTMRPALQRLRDWTGVQATRDEVSLRRRMLSQFGLPLLFTLTLSLLASIGLYRTLGEGLSLQEDFNAITALCASFIMLVLAVGGVFARSSRLLSEPLSELARAADGVASGQLEQRVPAVTGPAEVAGLGRSVERMRRTLARTIEELKQERAGLEVRVEQRTAELSQALDELKQAQTALIQGERMATIGQLMAGVAHEIYNPLNAIGGSVAALDRVSDELRTMLEAYQQAEAALPAAKRAELEALRAELDLSGALDDLVGVAKVVRSATGRSVDIVSNLKNFARASKEPEPADLHDGLRETLGLLAHRIKFDGIELHEAFGELPPVMCRAGEIHQVFMNLLTNAIQAVAAEDDGGPRRIELATRRDGDWVEVSVSDSGPGVPEELRHEVFDPFMTTKPRGEGTGLGLSISSEIVRRHGGTLTVEQAPEDFGGGARFVCRLPLERRRPSRRSAPRLQSDDGIREDLPGGA
jgi:signal transduction histidine kinase